MIYRQERYHPAIALLHWLMFLLFVIALTAIEARGFIAKTSEWRSTLTQIHMQAGQLVLLLAVVRVAVRFSVRPPSVMSGPVWQLYLSKLLHLVLYLVMFALPVAGIVFVQAGGHEVHFFGLTLPHFIAPNPDLRGTVKDAHEFIGNAVYYLVGLHILAALWHQLVMRDEILSRMRLR